MGAEVAPGRPLALVGQRAGLPVVLALVGARQHLQGGRVCGGCTMYVLPRAWTLLRPAWASGWGGLGLYLEAVNVELCRLQHVLGDLVRLQKLPAVCQVLHRRRPPTGGARTRGAAARRCGRQMVRTSAGRRSPDPRTSGACAQPAGRGTEAGGSAARRCPGAAGALSLAPRRCRCALDVPMRGHVAGVWRVRGNPRVRRAPRPAAASDGRRVCATMTLTSIERLSCRRCAPASGL